MAATDRLPVPRVSALERGGGGEGDEEEGGGSKQQHHAHTTTGQLSKVTRRRAEE